MDVRLVAADFESGLVKTERLPETATTLLIEGHDSLSLRRAAGSDHVDPDEQRRVFREALFELGQLPLTHEEVGAQPRVGSSSFGCRFRPARPKPSGEARVGLLSRRRALGSPQRPEPKSLPIRWDSSLKTRFPQVQQCPWKRAHSIP